MSQQVICTAPSFPQSNDPQPKPSQEVVISHFISLDEFYFQYSAYDDALKTMMVKLQRIAAISPPASMKSLAIGKLYFLVKKTSDGLQWYRVELLDIFGRDSNPILDNHLRFQYVDYGHVDILLYNWDVLRLITDPYMIQLPYFAIKARLADVFSPNLDGSYAYSRHLISENQKFLMEIVENGSITSVKLTNANGLDLASVLHRENIVKLKSNILPPSLRNFTSEVKELTQSNSELEQYAFSESKTYTETPNIQSSTVNNNANALTHFATNTQSTMKFPIELSLTSPQNVPSGSKTATAFMPNVLSTAVNKDANKSTSSANTQSTEKPAIKPSPTSSQNASSGSTTTTASNAGGSNVLLSTVNNDASKSTSPVSTPSTVECSIKPSSTSLQITSLESKTAAVSKCATSNVLSLAVNKDANKSTSPENTPSKIQFSIKSSSTSSNSSLGSKIDTIANAGTPNALLSAINTDNTSASPMNTPSTLIPIKSSLTTLQNVSSGSRITVTFNAAVTDDSLTTNKEASKSSSLSSNILSTLKEETSTKQNSVLPCKVFSGLESSNSRFLSKNCSVFLGSRIDKTSKISLLQKVSSGTGIVKDQASNSISFEKETGARTYQQKEDSLVQLTHKQRRFAKKTMRNEIKRLKRLEVKLEKKRKNLMTNKQDLVDQVSNQELNQNTKTLQTPVSHNELKAEEPLFRGVNLSSTSDKLPQGGSACLLESESQLQDKTLPSNDNAQPEKDENSDIEILPITPAPKPITMVIDISDSEEDSTSIKSSERADKTVQSSTVQKEVDPSSGTSSKRTDVGETSFPETRVETLALKVCHDSEATVASAASNVSTAQTVTISCVTKNEKEILTLTKLNSSFVDVTESLVQIGRKHPHSIVEPLQLAKIAPPKILYQLAIPDKVVSSGFLSNFQLETIKSICQQHESKLPDGSRFGFLLGDGPGVGKGRIIAGVIFENYLKGIKKAIWVTPSEGNLLEVKRDFYDVGVRSIGGIKVCSLMSMKKSEPISLSMKTGVLHLTYSYSMGAVKSIRLPEIFKWLDKDFNGVIVFDDCNRAGVRLIKKDSCKLSGIGTVMVNIQNSFPNAKVIYSGAFCDPQPSYMVRLGCELSTFEDSPKERMELKGKGFYLARQISYKNVYIKVEQATWSQEFVEVYDQSVKLWTQLFHSFSEVKKNDEGAWIEFWKTHHAFFNLMRIAPKVMQAVKLAKEAEKCGRCVVISIHTLDEKTSVINRVPGDTAAKELLGNFIKKHLPLYSYTAAEFYKTIRIPNGSKRKASPVRDRQLKKPKKDWSHLHSDSEISNFGSDDEWTPIINHSTEPTAVDVDNNNGNKETEIEREHTTESERLNKQIELLGAKLPLCPLDQLIDELGGPSDVAEMTSRRIRFVVKYNNGVEYQTRCKQLSQLEFLNRKERQSFMNGVKKFAIISESVDVSLTLQANKSTKNKCRRLHIILEMPSIVDEVLEQFGRTHRINQVKEPDFVLLVNDLASEKRIASMVLKRLESLGVASCQNKSIVQEFDGDECQLDFEKTYAFRALDSIVKASQMVKPKGFIPLPADYNSTFFKDATDALAGIGLVSRSDEKNHPHLRFAENSPNITELLKRLSGISIEIQNKLLKYYYNTVMAFSHKAQSMQTNSLNVENLASPR